MGVLGPIEASLDGVPLDLGTPKQRALVAALALSGGRAVSVDSLIDLLWGDSAPSTVTGTLQAYVSVLRRTLEPGRRKRTPAEVLVTVAPGYALRLPEDALDARTFDATVTEEHRRSSGPLLGPSRLAHDELEAVVAHLDDALGLWRGEPYADLDDAPAVVAERAHLDELRLVALEDRAVARLALGDHATTAAELEALTSAHPLRERLWALRALALVRSGRQADALEVLRAVRDVLADELGLDPGAELVDLQERVLRQDPALAWAPPTQPERPAPPAAPPAPPPPAAVPAPAAPAASATLSATPGATAATPAATPVGPASPWPLLGRDDELRAMRGALTAVRQGHPGFVVLTGEPGIGKSRLAAEIASLARAYGHVVAVGRCSQDEGAPPLWPWRTVFDTVGVDLPPTDDGEGADFRSWERIARGVEDFAARQPLTVVVEDLHWADTATLRVLRLLTEIDAEVPLLVVLTWRDRPEPTGALADLAESLGRRHALRLELTGVDEAAVGAMVSVVTRRRLAPQQARMMRRRTEGNPFFLIEYARAWRTGTDLDDLLRADPPTAVREVIVRRLARLPEQTRTVLGTAAVVGRRFDVATLAEATSEDEDDLLDRLEPAQAAGLVHEAGVDTFTFDHALVRDTVYGNLSASRRARRHGQVADALARRGGHESEAAHHLLAAGPSRAAEAWRAAVAAAREAMATHTYPEAAALLRRALEAQEADPGAGERERYDVLMELVVGVPVGGVVVRPERRGHRGRRGGRRHRRPGPRRPRGHRADARRDVADDEVRRGPRGHRLGAAPQPRRPAGGGLGPPVPVPARPGQRAVLRRVVRGASRAHGRGAGHGGPARRAERCACTPAWWPTRPCGCPRPRSAGSRLVEDALHLARELGEEHDEVTAGVLLTIVLGELGRPDRMWEVLDATRRQAERLRHVYGLLVLDSMVVPWLCMAGRFEEAEARLTSMIELADASSLHQVDEAIQGNFLVLALWRDRRLPLRGPDPHARADAVPDDVDGGGHALAVRRGGACSRVPRRARGGPGTGRLVLDAQPLLGRRGGGLLRRRRPRRPGLRRAGAVRRPRLLRRLRRLVRPRRRLPRPGRPRHRGDRARHPARRRRGPPRRGVADPAVRRLAARAAGPPRLLTHRFVSLPARSSTLREG